MENNDIPSVSEQRAERFLVALAVTLSWISALGLVAVVIVHAVLR